MTSSNLQASHEQSDDRANKPQFTSSPSQREQTSHDRDNVLRPESTTKRSVEKEDKTATKSDVEEDKEEAAAESSVEEGDEEAAAESSVEEKEEAATESNPHRRRGPPPTATKCSGRSPPPSAASRRG
ncbi:hypothetical protein PR003_g31894, partial [Phytophthora rubi]